MRARHLLENSAYQPETLAVLFSAFDGAWQQVSRYFDGDPEAVEAARARLAHAVLVVACKDSSDPDALKRDALQVLSLAYQQRFD